MKGNMPINNLINTWTAENYPANWEYYRAKWLRIFFYREIATITGFVSLVTGVVFGMK
jgi:MFS superfamily sulfate permease-like transporter